MIEINRKYQTQWAAQFFVSAELTRRGYMVALTLGNMPSVDLNVVSPGGKQFMVDVKGQRTKNFWRFRRKDPHKNHYYIFVYVPRGHLPRPQILHPFK